MDKRFLFERVIRKTYLAMSRLTNLCCKPLACNIGKGTYGYKPMARDLSPDYDIFRNLRRYS